MAGGERIVVIPQIPTITDGLPQLCIYITDFKSLTGCSKYVHFCI